MVDEVCNPLDVPLTNDFINDSDESISSESLDEKDYDDESGLDMD